MNKAFKYRIYPNAEQKKLLHLTFGHTRFVWNHVLGWRNHAYENNQEKMNYNQCSKYLTELKQEHIFLNDVSAVALQQTIRNQEKAFKNFFAKRAGYPNFKKSGLTNLLL